MPEITDKISKANSNTSAVTEDFARMHMGSDDFLVEFRAPFIQYGYIETTKSILTLIIL